MATALGLGAGLTRAAPGILPRGASAVAFVLVGAVQAARTRWTPAIQVLLLVVILALLGVAGIWAVPTGSQPPESPAAVGDTSLTATWLQVRAGRQRSAPARPG